MKSHLPHKAAECFFKQGGTFGDLNRLVIYSSDEENEIESRRIVQGYLDAANKIVDSLISAGTNAGDDILVFPMLNLFLNALEFSFKSFILELEDHRKKQTCKNISPPPDDYEKALGKHDLNSLLTIIATMLSNGRGIHKLHDLDAILAFVSELLGNGIDAISTRYFTGKDQKLFKLHKKQLAIDIKNFQANVNYICNQIFDCLEGEILYLCSTGEFTARRLQECIYARDILYKYSLLIQKNNFIWNEENAISHDELSAIAMGLCFCRSVSTIDNYSTFQKWSTERLNEHISKLAKFYETALEMLNKHILTIQELKDKNK